MRGLFSLSEALDAGTWPVARSYLVFKGVIYPRDDSIKPVPGDTKAVWRLTTTRALAQPRIFLTFARLAARENPSEDSILKWVHEHGLLHRRDPDRTSPYLPREKQDEPAKPNQKPLSVVDFQNEAKRAYKLLRLYELYRGGAVDELRSRIELVREVVPNEEPPPESSGFIEVHFDGVPAGHFVWPSEPLGDDEILEDCLSAVKRGIEPHLQKMSLAWGIHEKLALRCPDLLSAMYFQFAALVDGKRASALCKGCGKLFEQSRKNKRVCDDACRKAAKRSQENADVRPPTEAARDRATLRVVRAVRHGTTHHAEGSKTLCGLIIIDDTRQTTEAGMEVSCRNCRKLAEKRYSAAAP